MSILRRLYLGRRWWIMALPVVVCLALIAVDTRFAYVALIVAMAMVMLAMPLWYYFALTQESRWSILDKTVVATDEGLQLDFVNDKMKSHLITWQEMESTTAVSECLVIRLKKNKYTFLAIPFSAFDDKEELRELVKEIHRHIKS